MNDTVNYAVFLFPQAIETLGEAIKPYLTDIPPVGPHIVCSVVDTSGTFFQLTVQGRSKDDKAIEAELMLPNAFIKLIVSMHSEEPFGFGERTRGEGKSQS
ncbi:MAG TPA: hypothetical protein VIE67_12980 [Rudaea sp.]|uniref:hypothetical protein n=1 Tax=Rudaea sp. TaxID=2136325 RepID=UPI002F91C4DE